MELYIIWFTLALILLLVEMSLVSFYLLAVALGCILGGILDLLGYDINLQLILSGIITIIASIATLYLRKSLKKKSDTKINNLDLGQRVVIKEDMIQADGSARVIYRGSRWTAYKENYHITPGIYTIANIDGTRLLLDNKINDINDTSSQQIEENSNNVEQGSILDFNPHAYQDEYKDLYKDKDK